jgi:hypothetical protein
MLACEPESLELACVTRRDRHELIQCAKMGWWCGWVCYREERGSGVDAGAADGRRGARTEASYSREVCLRFYWFLEVAQMSCYVVG